MISKDKIFEIESKLDVQADFVYNPKRFVDYEITTSFAHCTINVTADEISGYFLLEKLREKISRNMNMLICDYDGICPGKERPKAYCLENALKDKQNFPPIIRIISDDSINFVEESPMIAQNYNKNMILKNIDREWLKIIKKSGFSREDKNYVEDRFLEVIQAIKSSAEISKDMLEFLEKFRANCLSLAGINICGKPESKVLDIFGQKLEEDLEAGYPFWKMELPENFERKHKSNDSTYLFRSFDAKKDFGSLEKLVFNKVKFMENPDRFEFEYKGEKNVIRAEESIAYMRKGLLFPTTTLLNYIVLSPARKKPDNDSKKRIHMAGQFMAGEKGYAKELIPYFNKYPGYDKVSLVCTGYDGSMMIKNKNNFFIGFGAIYPQFGREGIQNSLINGCPFSLKRGEVYGK